MKLTCPECGRSHRAYPWDCVAMVENDNTHVVITRMLQGNLGERWVKQAMDTYLIEARFLDPKARAL